MELDVEVLGEERGSLRLRATRAGTTLDVPGVAVLIEFEDHGHWSDPHPATISTAADGVLEITVAGAVTPAGSGLDDRVNRLVVRDPD